jgi:Zn-dependent protease with chaperone function
MSVRRTCTGCGKIHEVADTIEEVAARNGLKSRRESPTADTIFVHLIPCVPWYRILLRALFHRARWTLIQTAGDTFEITLDASYAHWYLALIVLQSFVMASLLIAGFAPLGQPEMPDGSTMFVSTWMVVMGVGLVFLGAHLLNAIDATRTGPYWQAIRDRVESDVPLLQVRPSQEGRWYLSAHVIYLGFVLAAAIAAFMASGGLDRPVDPGWLGLLLSLFLCGACLTLVVRQGRHVDARVAPGLPGFASIAGVALFVGAALPWYVTAGRSEVPAMIAHLRASLAERPTSLSEEMHIELRQNLQKHLTTVRALALSHILISVFISVIGVWYFLHGLSLSIRTWQLRRRLARFREHPALRDIVEGDVFMRCPRLLFLVPWCIVSSLMLLETSCIASSTTHALTGGYWGAASSPATRAVDDSVVLVGLALGPARGSRGIEIAVRSSWVVYGSICLTAFGLSVGQLLRARRRMAQRLRLLPEADPADAERAVGILDQLAQKGRCPRPRLAIRTAGSNKDKRPALLYASSHCFGLIRRQQFIELSSGCLTLLKDRELEALLAHELAHFLCGDDFLDALLRMLGRLTFVGDQTVRLFQLTVGYELDADRVAVEKLGADPQALIRCLWKVRNVRAAEGASAPSGIEGYALLPGQDGADIEVLIADLQSSSFTARWRTALRFFLWQYTSASKEGSVYWHPSIDRRVKALRAMAAHDPRPVRSS